METLIVRVAAVPAAVLVRFVGELDAETAVRARAQALAAIDQPGEFIVLDLSELRFCDATGIRLIFSLGTAFAEAGRRFVVRRPTGVVRRVLELSGAERMVIIDT